MKKRILALALAALAAVSFTGCGGQELSDEYVTVKQYKGLKIPKAEAAEVTDQMVDQTVNSRLYHDMIREEITDRPADDGDTVIIDFTGSIDGAEFEGGSAKDAELKLGSGSFIGATEDYAGFEEQIVGHNIGDEFDITVQFPSEYKNNPAMENKVAVFHIVLHKIVKEQLPELTDEWVQKNSETAKTVEEFKKEIREKLESDSREGQKTGLRQGALQALLEKVEVKAYPEGMVEARIEKADKYYRDYAAAYEMEFKDFCSQMLGKTEEEYNKAIKEMSEEMIKMELACKLIAREKKLEPPEEQYNEKIQTYAEASGFESAEKLIGQVGEEELKNMILQEIVGDYLVENSVQTEQEGPTPR